MSEKKEKVIHTRVPESLDSELKARARSLGISVSNLVRNVLGNTFGLVEGIVVDSTTIARAASGEPVEVAPGSGSAEANAKPNRVLGWQDSVLNVNAVCEHCNALLPKGSRAAIAVNERPGPKSIICGNCLGEMSDG